MGKIIFQHIGDWDKFLFLVDEIGDFYLGMLKGMGLKISEDEYCRIMAQARCIVIDKLPHEIIREGAKLDEKIQSDLSLTRIKKGCVRARDLLNDVEFEINKIAKADLDEQT